MNANLAMSFGSYKHPVMKSLNSKYIGFTYLQICLIFGEIQYIAHENGEDFFYGK